MGEGKCPACGITDDLNKNDGMLSYSVETCSKHPGAVSAHFLSCKKCNTDTPVNQDVWGCYKCKNES